MANSFWLNALQWLFEPTQSKFIIIIGVGLVRNKCMISILQTIMVIYISIEIIDFSRIDQEQLHFALVHVHAYWIKNIFNICCHIVYIDLFLWNYLIINAVHIVIPLEQAMLAMSTLVILWFHSQLPHILYFVSC